MDFAEDWQDSDDNDPTGGRFYIRSATNRLRIENMDYEVLSRRLNLQGASGVTLSFTYTEMSGNERIDVQLWNGTGWNTVANLNGSGTVNYNLAANEMSAASEIRFVTDSDGWGSTEAYEIDNLQFNGNVPPGIAIDDITVNEDDGTATFTVTLSKAFAGGFTVDWATSDGTALNGSDYVADNGTLSFAGTAGETQTIVINLINDAIPEFNNETFTLILVIFQQPAVLIADIRE